MLKATNNWAWWHRPVKSVLGSLKQDDLKFKASLHYMAQTLSGKKKKKKQTQTKA
jgi:hypothetical protein